MGSDLSMNPPKPAQYVVLVSPDLGAIGVYKYPGEMESLSRAWHRTLYVHNQDDMRIREAVVQTAKALGARLKEVESDAVIERVIVPTAMHDLLYPPEPVYRPKHGA